MAAATNGASGASAAKAARTKAGEKQRMDVGRGLFRTGRTYRAVVEECQRGGNDASSRGSQEPPGTDSWALLE